MATAALYCCCSLPRTPALGSGKAFRRTAVGIPQTRSWPSQVFARRPFMCADYSDRRGGAGDFVLGFFIAGAAFGALVYILAPQSTRLSINEKIFELNTTIDDVSAQLGIDEGLSTFLK